MAAPGTATEWDEERSALQRQLASARRAREELVERERALAGPSA